MGVLSRWGIAPRSSCTYSGARAQGSRGGAQSAVVWHCTSVATGKLGWGNFLARSKLAVKNWPAYVVAPVFPFLYSVSFSSNVFMHGYEQKVMRWSWPDFTLDMGCSTYFKFVRSLQLATYLRDTIIFAIFFGWSYFSISIHIRVLLLSISTI